MYLTPKINGFSMVLYAFSTKDEWLGCGCFSRKPVILGGQIHWFGAHSSEKTLQN